MRCSNLALPIAAAALFTLGLATPSEAAEHRIVLENNLFSPSALTIQVGDTVVWENRSGIHSVTADDASFERLAGGAPWTFSRTFTSAGSVSYFCSVHGGAGGVGMAGQLTVVGASATGTLSLSSSTYSARESAANLTATVRRLGGDSGGASVQLTTVPGSATPLLDFGALTTTVEWDAGDDADKTVAIPILQDDLAEGDETFTVRLDNATGATLGTPATATATIRDDDNVSGPCVGDAQTLCLVGSRFRATLTWENQFNGTSGVGGAITNTDLSGFFYFTDPNNVEIILKVLDFGEVIKVFYGQLTDLHFQLTIVDTHTGAQKVYGNGPDNCGDIDQAAFEKYGIDRERLAKHFLRVTRGKVKRQPGTCVASSTVLCLLNRRFALELTWRNQFNGVSGVGGAVPLTNLTGLFFFTDPANAELMVKTLDFGNEQILILYGALSDLEYHMKVTDTTTGAVKQYDNPPGKYCGGIDRDAF